MQPVSMEYCVPGSVLDTGDPAVKTEKKKIFALVELTFGRGCKRKTYFKKKKELVS